MDIEISLKKSLEENAEVYFERAKKAKHKLEGAKEALARSLKLTRKKPEVRVEPTKPRKRLWYEKFRWFFSSDRKLVLLGRDATTNEILIKKHTEPRDVVFHIEGLKGPFCVVKLEGENATRKTLSEAADATGSFSEAWKRGLSEVEVFYVKPEQVSKQAQAGEYLTKGMFMIYGKKSFIQAAVKLAVGVTKEGHVMCGPPAAIKANCMEYIEIYPGGSKRSDIAKALQKRIGGGLDELLRVLPSGGISLK